MRIPLFFAIALIGAAPSAAQIKIQPLAGAEAPNAGAASDRALDEAIARRSGARRAPAQLAARKAYTQIGVKRRDGGAPVLPPLPGDAGFGIPQVSAASSAPSTQTLATPARLGRITGQSVDFYRTADVKSPWISRLAQGQQVAIAAIDGLWMGVYMSDGTVGYALAGQIEILPYMVNSIVIRPAKPEQPAGGGDLARAIIAEAFRYENVKYVYGGNGFSGIDCSGLVRNCFSAHGISLPRRASEQATVGQAVPLDQLQPGDRLYFSVRRRFDHTGIYLGDGYFIHAASSRKKVTVDHLGTRLFSQSLAAARR